MLLDPYRFGLPVSVALTGLVSYWKLDEASGDAVDSHGSNHLNDPGVGVGTAAGKINTARDFQAGSKRVQINSNSTVQMGDIPFTFTAWIKYRTTGAGMNESVILSKDNGASSREYWLYSNLPIGASSRISAAIFPAGTTAGGVTVVGNALGAQSLGVWYFVVFWHDPAADKIYLQVNNGGIDEAAVSGGAFVGTAQFRIGAREPSFSSFDGQIDEVGFWKRLLTPSERAALYNAGTGLPYPFGPVAPVAVFSGTPLTGTFPLAVTFTDLSTQTPTSWAWEKNNGSGWVPFAGTPNAQNPVETFAAGTWSVRLTATNSMGSGVASKPDYISNVVYAKWTIKSDAGVTFSNGDKTAATVSGTHIWLTDTQLKVSFGRKLYWEVRVDAITSNHQSNGLKNIADSLAGTFNSGNFASAYNGGIQSGGGWSGSGGGTSYGAGDTLMFAIDEAAGKVWLGRNGVWLNSGNPPAGTGHTWGNMPPAQTFAAGSGVNSPGAVNGTTIRAHPLEMLYAVPAGFTGLLSST